MEDELSLLLEAVMYQSVYSFGLCTHKHLVHLISLATHFKNELSVWHDYGTVRLFHKFKRSTPID